MTDPIMPCVVCHLPQTRNPHPDAGKPSHLNEVGAMWGCLPCAERRANGRRKLITELKQWLKESIEHLDGDDEPPGQLMRIRLKTLAEVAAKIDAMEEQRRHDFHVAK